MVDDPEVIVRQAAKLDEQYRALTAMVRGPEAANRGIGISIAPLPSPASLGPSHPRVNRPIRVPNAVALPCARPTFLLNRGTAANRKIVATTAGYLRNNASFMPYKTCLAHGWPIATGVVEGACGHLVKDRMERAGMKWTKPGAQAVLDLRSVRVNDHWDDYQSFRRQRAHLRSYRSPHASDLPPERQILQAAA